MTRQSRFFFLIVFSFVTFDVNFAITQATPGGDTTSSSIVLFKLVHEIENFRNQLNSIDAQLKVIQKSIQQSTSFDDSKCSVHDITEAIKEHNFKLAGEKADELSDIRRLTNVIHDLYLDSPANVDIILEFIQTLKENEARLIAFSALREELHSGGNSDPVKMIRLTEDLERVVARQRNPEFKAKAQIVIDSAIEDIQAGAKNIFKNAMMTGKYKGNVEIESLAQTLSNFRTDVSNNVMESVVDSVFGVVAAVRIIENISSHKDIAQVIAGLSAIFNRFNYGANLNNDATIHLALHLRQLQMRDNYVYHSPAIKKEVENVIQQLPTCARNLNLNTNVCLWNKGRGKYLYAASSSISYDAERRSIYTWYTGAVTAGAVWKLEKIGDDFYFKNVEHENEYMYSAFDYNKDMRYVFSWIPGNNTDSQSAWTIELNGDYCYIKTRHFNEYMFSPAMKRDQQNDFVFTWMPGSLNNGPDYLWQILKC